MEDPGILVLPSPFFSGIDPGIVKPLVEVWARTPQWLANTGTGL